MGVNAATALAHGVALYPSGSFEDEVQQEMFARERNARVQFASLMVNAVMAATRVIIAEEPMPVFTAMQAEVGRLLDVYEAEVQQDLYRPDVQAALIDRLKRREEAAIRQKALDLATSKKLEDLTETD